MDIENVVIIGSGPAGYTAAIYAARASLNPLLFSGIQPGGQLTTTNEVENFPGYPEGINGTEMMVDLQKQAERFGTRIQYATVTKVDFTKRPFTLLIDDRKQICAHTVIIATGASAKYLGLPSEKIYMNRGVSGCAVCDGYFYRGKDVAVVGGGDTAAEESLYLSKLCKHVHLIVRRNEMRASKIMQERVKKMPNIQIHWDTETEEILGDGSEVTGIRIKNLKTNSINTIPLSGFFLAIGHQPNTAIFKGQLNFDEKGYILTKPGTPNTNVEGVFAVGDVADRVYRQAITAAGSGCMGALEAERYLMGRHESQPAHIALSTT